MRRYGGERLRSGARIAVIANDAIGNYVVITPLLQMLRERHQPAFLGFFSGPRTVELWSKDPNIEGGQAIYGKAPREVAETLLEQSSFDLIVNVESSDWSKAVAALLAGADSYICGPSLCSHGRSDLAFEENERGDLWRDSQWIAADLTSKYPFLKTGFIGEIFCRLAYLEGSIPPYRVPCGPVAESIPDVLIAMSASLPEKLWPLENWRQVLLHFRDLSLSVGLLGAPPSSQKQFWQGNDTEETVVREGLALDLRGRWALPEVVGALAKARLVFTLDNGILHLAAAAGAPTIGLFREGIHRLWAPPSPCLKVVVPTRGAPVSGISAKRAIEELPLAQ